MARGFTTADRHNGQAIATREHDISDLFLTGAELLVIKDFLQNLPSAHFQIRHLRLRHINPISLR